MMKTFRPEGHHEVGRDLAGLLRRVKERHPEVEDGTSGSGEITLRFDRRYTFYARKYRRREGWGLTCYLRGSGLRPERLWLADVDAVVDLIGRLLDEKE